MSKVSRDMKKKAAEGKLPKKAVLPAEASDEQPKAKGYPAACCRCKSYKRTADDGAKCKVTGKHTARKSKCSSFSWKD